MHRGGLIAYQPMRDDIQRKLKQEKSEDVRFTTIIDLYAFPGEFPGLAEAEKLRPSPVKRVEALEQAFAEDIGDPRFIPYIQLHEYEAYLFSDPAKFRFFYSHHETAITKIEAIAAKFDTPEMINDGLETSPSKRIIKALPDYDGSKPVAGPLTADEIGIETIWNKCRHFHAWLSRFEQLGIQP